MMLSPAWQHAPRPLRRILERLEIEHLRHGAQNNGELFVSFGQFVEYGVSRRSIRPTLELGEALGLLQVTRPHENISDIRPPNAYRLTYVEAKGSAAAPTDEWKSVNIERTLSLIGRFKSEEKAAATATRKAAA